MANTTPNFLKVLRSSWEELSPSQQKLVSILGAVDTAGKAAALASLARTDAKQVRGPKFVWGPIIAAVNTIGWVAWFLVGRKKGD